MTVNCPYNLFERLKAELSGVGGSLENAQYAQDVTVRLLVPEEAAGFFSARISEMSAGKMAACDEESVFLAGKLS